MALTELLVRDTTPKGASTGTSTVTSNVHVPPPLSSPPLSCSIAPEVIIEPGPQGSVGTADATRPARPASKSTENMMAEAEGASMKFKPLQKVGAIIGALKSGQIDAWSIVPHIAKPLSAAGAWHMVGNVSDYIPDYQVTTVFTSANNAAKERGLTESFLQGFSRGVDDYAAAMIDGTADQDEMVDLIHKYVYTDRPRAKAAPSIINGSMRLNKDAAINVTSVADQLAWMQAQGLVDSGITLETFLDTSYVETIGA